MNRELAELTVKSSIDKNDRVITTLQDSGFVTVLRAETTTEKCYIVAAKTGHWKRLSPQEYECSECGQNVMTNDISDYNFCRGCGAIMIEAQESIMINGEED